MDLEAALDPTPPKGWRRIFAALGERDFRIFYSGQLVSQLGTWMRSAALGWITLQRTGSEFWLGMVTVATTLPLLLLSPWAGSLADRWPRLRIFQATSVLAFVASCALAALLFADRLSTPLIFGLATLWGVATAFEIPARQSMVVDLAGRRNLVNAIALNSASVNGTRVVGPALGGLLLSAVGAAWCFMVDALSYLVVLGATLRLPLRPAQSPGNEQGTLSHLREGAAYVWGHRALRPALLMLLSMSLFGWAYLSQMAAMAKLGLGLGPRGYGLLLGANGLGAVAAALLVAFRGAKNPLRRQMAQGIAIYGVGLFCATLPQDAWLSAAGFATSGFGVVLFFASCNSYVQTRTQNRMRGRVMGLYALVFGGGMPLGSLWMAVAAEQLGVRAAMRIAAVLGTLFATLLSRSGRRRRRVRAA